MARSKRIPKVPIHGKAAHNAAFLVSIGNLIVNWSNNESVFMAMLQVLIRGESLSAAIVWHSHRTTYARLELVDRLCREQVKNADLVDDVRRTIKRFKELSTTRNFYCHATYRYDADLNLGSAAGVSSPADGDPIAFETKRMDRATLNEIGQTSISLGELNRKLWSLVDRLQKELEVQRADLPQMPTEPK